MMMYGMRNAPAKYNIHSIIIHTYLEVLFMSYALTIIIKTYRITCIVHV